MAYGRKSNAMNVHLYHYIIVYITDGAKQDFVDYNSEAHTPTIFVRNEDTLYKSRMLRREKRLVIVANNRNRKIRYKGSEVPTVLALGELYFF